MQKGYNKDGEGYGDSDIMGNESNAQELASIEKCTEWTTTLTEGLKLDKWFRIQRMSRLH